MLVGPREPVRPACEVQAALSRIRDARLYWPAPRACAARPRVLALDAAGLRRARAAHADADIALRRDVADVDPERLERVYGSSGAAALWAAVGGLLETRGADAPVVSPPALLSGADARCPWTGAALPLAEAVEAHAFLREAALRARGPAMLRGMSGWKRRCLRPFFTGPDGPPRARVRPGRPGPVVAWGMAGGAADLRVEDGFIRSVGLGLRHTPPVSLVVAPGPPYYDATRRTAFEALAAGADFTPALTARAARLRARLLALRLTKYNLPDAPPPPDPGGRLALLAPGQVATDASIRLGATTVRTDLALLQAARRRFPDAFILYKPHPDAVTGLRRGAASAAEALRFADALETRASAAQCLDWADRVAVITSQMGFEALLRDKPVTTFGRPFYAGWGLTDDVDPPRRDRTLTLEALIAAALILHARYVDPFTGLPAPPEVAIEALARQRAAQGAPGARAVWLWRDAASWLLNLPGRIRPW